MTKKATSECYAEHAHYAAISIPKLYDNTLALATAMFKGNLFRPGSGPRAAYLDYTPMNVTNGWTLLFKGEELRQDDERVLLALIKLRSGDVVSNVIKFVPRTFCREVLKWADSGENAEKLKACIKRLHDARVRVTQADGIEHLYSFVSEATIAKDYCSVSLSTTMADMFKSQVTYLDMDKRLAMKDGLLSWMYGFIKADACFAPFDLHKMRDLAGSSYEQKDFNKQLKQVLKKLQDDRIIRGFVLGGGTLKITK